MTTARPTPHWICLALVAAACSNPADPAQPVQRLHIVAAGAATDTISAQPGQAPVVEIRNATGIDGQSRPLVLMDRTGSQRRFLTPGDHRYPDGQLTWSPDGQWILARGPVALELIHVASGLILPLGFTRSVAEPAWRPASSSTIATHSNKEVAWV
jgi:Tol biopolymer transport system component